MPDPPLHPRLAKQLDQLGLGPDALPPELRQAVEESYARLEQDRQTLEKTIQLTSEELLDRNQALLDQVLQQERITEELGQSMSLLRCTLEATGDGILGVDTSGRVITYNRHLVEMWELDEQRLQDGDGAAVLKQMVELVGNPEAWRRDLRHLEQSPEIEWLDIVELRDGRAFERYTQPQRLGEQMVGRIWSFRDVSERYRLEAQMRQSQKLEAVGRLAGGIAHDFNNLLTVISGCCGLLELLPDHSERAGILVGEIQGAARRATDLTRQLLAFSRRQPMDPKPVDLHDVVGDMEGMLDRLLGDDIQLGTDLQASSAVALTDPVQIQQVVLNLAINARDAMRHGGHIDIGTESLVVGDGGLAFGQGRLEPGKYVVLRVRDDGEGIPAATLGHIFEPFFTTKGDVGTGLGLATVYGIVAKSGGLIDVESQVGRGTEFRVALPLVEVGPKAEAEAVPREETEMRKARLLLVEDNDTVRLVLEETLEQLGHSVVSEALPMDALKKHAMSIASFDLLVSDVMMPELNGYELALELRRVHPSLKILFVTGYAEDLDRPEELRRQADLLSKPFKSDVLEERIQRLLALTPD